MKISPTKYIDFTEIGDHYRFEKFAQHFLEGLNYRIPEPPSKGPDRGRDIVASERVRHSRKGYRWLVSCKYLDKTIGQNDDCAKIQKLHEHECDAFMFIYSNEVTSSFHDSVREICRSANKEYKFYTAHDIEKELLSNPSLINTFLQYFPESFEKFSRIKEYKCEHKWHEEYAYYEPLYLVAHQKNKREKVNYTQVCYECIREYCDGLREEEYYFESTILINEFNP